MSRPSEAVRAHLLAELERRGLVKQLGDAMFSPLNWHQSLSDRFENAPELVERLLSAVSKISTRAPRFNVDRIQSKRGPNGTHWEVLPARVPDDFRALLLSVKAAISTVDRGRQRKHSPHITLSYWAPEPLHTMVQLEPIEWIMDEVLLVRGGGDPYRYEVVGHWPLLPPRVVQTSEQLGLF